MEQVKMSELMQLEMGRQMTLNPTPRAMSVDSLSAMQLEIASPNNRILLHSRDVGGVMVPDPASSAGDRLAIDKNPSLGVVTLLGESC